MTKEEFVLDVQKAMLEKPREWRNGQAVFNYIDSAYGVARTVQFKHHIDCFYNDECIKEFIDKAYEVLTTPDINDFPGDNMVHE